MGRLKRMSAALQPPERTMLQRLVDFVRGLARWALRLTLSAVVSAALAIGGAIGLFESGRLGASADQFAEPAIMAIIAQESAVLYADGQTRIGVFFAQEHRQYVPFERLPTAWVDAIVAAEDQRFWEHPGVDPQGIARAMVQNLKAGGLVAGGSSLTQQTAKNLFYRPDRSLRSKVDELANALRLEHAFGADDKRAGKKKILEFYANQFHVSHNGRGIAIAARYFFDKDVGELDVLECAFIAGLVKAPANYNPFIGATEERRAKARARAQARTGYVLDRMLAMGKLSHEEHARLRAMEIPFRRGVFRYDSSVLLDEVAARLEQAPFPEVFAQLGIDNPSTAGLEVVTTLDVHAQRAAFYALGHHLSEVGPVLEDLRPERLRLPPAPDGAEAPQSFVEGGFYEAVVRENDGKKAVVAVGAESCVIDAAAVTRMAAVFARAKDGIRSSCMTRRCCSSKMAPSGPWSAAATTKTSTARWRPNGSSARPGSRCSTTPPSSSAGRPPIRSTTASLSSLLRGLGTRLGRTTTRAPPLASTKPASRARTSPASGSSTTSSTGSAPKPSGSSRRRWASCRRPSPPATRGSAGCGTILA